MYTNKRNQHNWPANAGQDTPKIDGPVNVGHVAVSNHHWIAARYAALDIILFGDGYLAIDLDLLHPLLEVKNLSLTIDANSTQTAGLRTSLSDLGVVIYCFGAMTEEVTLMYFGMSCDSGSRQFDHCRRWLNKSNNRGPGQDSSVALQTASAKYYESFTYKVLIQVKVDVNDFNSLVQACLLELSVIHHFTVVLGPQHVINTRDQPIRIPLADPVLEAKAQKKADSNAKAADQRRPVFFSLSWERAYPGQERSHVLEQEKLFPHMIPSAEALDIARAKAKKVAADIKARNLANKEARILAHKKLS